MESPCECGIEPPGSISHGVRVSYPYISIVGYNSNVFKILTGQPTGKRLLGRPRHRWEGNIRMDLEEIGINAGNFVDSAQDRDYWGALLNAALNLRVA